LGKDGHRVGNISRCHRVKPPGPRVGACQTWDRRRGKDSEGGVGGGEAQKKASSSSNGLFPMYGAVICRFENTRKEKGEIAASENGQKKYIKRHPSLKNCNILRLAYADEKINPGCEENTREKEKEWSISEGGGKNALVRSKF